MYLVVQIGIHSVLPVIIHKPFSYYGVEEDSDAQQLEF